MNSTAHARLLTGLLSTSRIRLNVSAPSKKRMLEELAGLLSHNRSDLHRDTVFQVLNERERLGSTGIGGGIALPHGRLNGLTEPLAAVIRLRQALDFDSVDDKPIQLIVGLLVPANATEQHLNILASLAETFNNREQREAILRSRDAQTLFALLT
ncbi:MAG: PTS sugar transporter subunit IIA [Gammaproteobacteria bacterium]|nr:MAG: PTS sugar transporter subunit IIA [Gammaproteobacteria bacterium]